MSVCLSSCLSHGALVDPCTHLVGAAWTQAAWMDHDHWSDCVIICVDSKDEGTKVTPMWIAEAMVNGEVWGKGRGNTKKAAKNEAAKEGLARLGWSDVSYLLACIRNSALVSV